MSLTANFATSQTYGVPDSINFVDTSVYTGINTITSRRIYMKTAANTYLVQKGTYTNYEVWGINNSSITLNVLPKDYALEITVEWVAGNTVVTSKVYNLGFTLYNETFDYQLTQVLSGNPLVINDNNFFPNKSDLRVNIDSGNQAIFFATDLFAAQQCYDRATNLRLNSQYYFNANS